MKIPKGFSREDLKKRADYSTNQDGITSLRIDDFTRDCIAYNIPDHEAVLLIKKRFNVDLSIGSYCNRKSKLSSDVEVQAWLNAYARSGFVREHILDMDRMRLSIETIMKAIHTETEKEHDQRDWRLITNLQKELRESIKLATQLRLGAPVMARVKAMINTANVDVIEKDPHMTEEKRQKLLKGVPIEKSALTMPYVGEEYTGDENTQKATVISSREMVKSENVGTIGIVTNKKKGSIDWDGVEQEIKGEIVSKNNEIVIDPSKIEYESHSGDSGRGSDVSDTQSFFKFIMEGGEGSNDDILPKRTKSGLDITPKGKTTVEVGSDTGGASEPVGTD